MNRLLDPGNRLVALARNGRPTPVLMACLLAIFVSLFAPALGLLLVQALLFPGGPDSTQEPLLAAAAHASWLVVGYGSYILFVWLWLRSFEGRPFRTLGFERQNAPGKILRGVLLGLLMVGAVAAILAALGYADFEREDPQLQGLAALDGVLLVAVGWAVQGSAEEVVSRGWLFQTAATRYGPPAGVILSALVFSFLHVLNPGITALALTNIFLTGIFFALYALYSGSLWGVCALHATLNWTEANIFGFDLNGQELPGGVLFNLREAGPDIVTGGGVGAGITGGLAWTAVVVLAIAAIAILSFSRQKTAKITPSGNQRDPG